MGIKVLMVGSDSTVKGGITSVITQLINHNWENEGVEMGFIPTHIKGNPLKKAFFFFKEYLKMKKRIQNDKPDVVHIHMSYKGSFVRKYLIHRLCISNNIADVIHLHGSEFKKWYDSSNEKQKKRIQKMLKEAGAFIVLGNKWNEIIKNIQPDTNTVVVSNTVRIPNDSVRLDCPFKILFLGVLIKRKGVSDLLKATKILKECVESNQFRIEIAGSGDEEDNLIKESKELEVDDVVDFLGWTDGEKKLSLLKNCQMLVLPSYNEGLPIAILEALSYGMPVVATDVGDISSTVINGENGYLIKPGDFEQLALALSKIITNKDLYMKMSKASKQLVKDNYSEDEYFSNIKNCYLSLMKY